MKLGDFYPGKAIYPPYPCRGPFFFFFTSSNFTALFFFSPGGPNSVLLCGGARRFAFRRLHPLHLLIVRGPPHEERWGSLKLINVSCSAMVTLSEEVSFIWFDPYKRWKSCDGLYFPFSPFISSSVFLPCARFFPSSFRRAVDEDGFCDAQVPE